MTLTPVTICLLLAAVFFAVPSVRALTRNTVDWVAMGLFFYILSILVG